MCKYSFLHVLYFVLAFYHFSDLACNLYCRYYIVDSNSYWKAEMTATCLFGAICKFYFFRRFLKTLPRLRKPDIGRINIAAVLLPELKFNVLEIGLNLFQSILGGDIISSKIKATSCVEARHFIFACFCCIGAVGQCILLLKSVCGCCGERSLRYPSVVGIFLSLLSLYFGLPSIANVELSRFC